MPLTVQARLLLGWMPRNEALEALVNKCIPGFVEADALQRWETYRAKVAALPPRQYLTPKPLKMNKPETKGCADLKRNPPKMKDKLHDIAKIDPSGVVIHQFWVLTERSEEYAGKMHNDRQRIRYCFGKDTQIPTTVDQGTLRIISLPHFEYELQQFPKPDGTKHIHIQECPRLIAGVQLKDRTLLWGGYHRTYALLSQMEPDGLVVPPLVSLITNPDVDAFFSNASLRPEVRDTVLSNRAARFGDFFDNDLIMEVALRKQVRQVRLDSATNNCTFGFFDAES